MTAPHAPSPATPGDLLPIAEEDLGRLRTRLAHDAAAADLLDVTYRVVATPIGPLLLAATATGLVRVAFEREGFDHVLVDLAHRIGPRVLAAPDLLEEPASQIEEYFAGSRRAFDLPLDHRLSAGFRLDVQRLLPGIRYGTTVTYGRLAELAGNPRAVRAVGTACATNPLPVVVPCHRVLRSDGTVGGYLGGPETKTALLALEAAA